MIKIEIDSQTTELSYLRVNGKKDVLAYEFFELFDKLDENCKDIFRAAVFAYINTNEEVLRDYERISETPLTKCLKALIKELPNEDDN